jgi:hypothetical protein
MASFTQHVFKARLCGRLCQNFFPGYGQIMVHCVMVKQNVVHSVNSTLWLQGESICHMLGSGIAGSNGWELEFLLKQHNFDLKISPFKPGALDPRM